MRPNISAFRADYVASRVQHVAGVLARRIAQFGPPRLLASVLRLDDSGDAASSTEMLLHEWAADGDLELLRDWAGGDALQFKPDTFAAAALNGHAHVVAWLLFGDVVPKRPTITPLLLARVAALGHKELLETLLVHLQADDVQRDELVRIAAQVQGQPPAKRPRGSSRGVAHTVFSTPALLSYIYSFPSPRTTDFKALQRRYKGPLDAAQVPGLLMRLAIVFGDLAAVRDVYTLAGIPRFARLPKFSLATAMHDAAGEGRVDVLPWLSTQPGVGRCRPDTMAAAVRGDWPDVVRWLHANAPESSLSMSGAPLIDAAAWGFLDVLRVCYELAIVRGDSSVVDADVHWSEAAVDRAIVNGHTAVVRWLFAEFPARGSPHAVHETVVAGNLDVLQLLHSARGKEEAFCRAVETGIVAIVTEPALYKLVEYAIHHCLLNTDGVTAVVHAVVEHLSGESVVSHVQQLVTCYPASIKGLMELAVRRGDIQVLLLLLHDHRSVLEPDTLADAFRIAVAGRCDVAVDVFMVNQVHACCSEVLPLLAAYGTLAFVEQAFPYRTRDSAVEALSAASTTEIATFLLQNETQFFTEAVLLQKIPAAVSAQVVRFILRHGRGGDRHQATDFAGVVDEDNSALTLDEVDRLRSLSDAELNDLLRRHHSLLMPVDATLRVSTERWMEIHAFLHYLGVQFQGESLDAAIVRGRVHEVEWLVARDAGLDLAITDASIREAARESHVDVLAFLHRRDPDKANHALRLGLRLAYDEAETAGDNAQLEQLTLIDADDLTPLLLVRIAEQGHASLATALAATASAGDVVDAITRATEMDHFGVVVALLDARGDVELAPPLRVRLGELAQKADQPDVSRRLMGMKDWQLTRRERKRREQLHPQAATVAGSAKRPRASTRSATG